jgi:hypothetical protein
VSATIHAVAVLAASSSASRDIFRTYFIKKRGDEPLGSAWAYLDS